MCTGLSLHGETFELCTCKWNRIFKISGMWSVHASKHTSIHTHARNEVTLVWGSLRLAPIINGNRKKHQSWLLRETGSGPAPSSPPSCFLSWHGDYPHFDLPLLDRLKTPFPCMGWDWSWVMEFPLISLLFWEVEYDRPSLNPFIFQRKVFTSCVH